MIVEELELVPTDEPERRRAPRPKPPQPAAMAPRMRQLVDWLVEWVESGWLGWAVYALLCIASVAAIVYSMGYRLDRLDENYALVAERQMLQREFEELAEHYSQDELRALMDRIHSAESTIFQDYEALAAWITEQAEAASQEGLLLTYVMHEKSPSQIKNVGTLPITLNVRPGEGGQERVYYRLLGFLRAVIDTPWHLKISDAAIRSDGVEVLSLDITFNVWVEMSS